MENFFFAIGWWFRDGIELQLLLKIKNPIFHQNQNIKILMQDVNVHLYSLFAWYVQ